MSADTQPKLSNPVMDRMKSGEASLGICVRLSRSGDIVRIAKGTGHDFIFLDVQHSLFDRETIGHMAHAALGCGVAFLVRVGSVDDPHVSVLLDNGVTGIVFPDVNTAAEARKAVARSKFPPIGARSVAGGYPQFDYRPVPLADAMPALNESTLVVCMIETPEGLSNVEEIAAVEGVDVVHVGTNDLLTNMGKAGKFDDPEILAAQDRVVAAAKAHGKFAGCGGNRDVERQARAIQRGARFVTTQTDTAFLNAAAGRWAQDLRAKLKG